MTLIEIVISLALLAIIAISLLSVFTTSFSWIFNYGRRSKSVMESNKIVDKIYETTTQKTYTVSSQIEDMINNLLINEGYSGNFEKSTTLSDLCKKTGSELIRYYVSSEETKSGVAGFSVYICLFQPNSNQSVVLTTFITKGGVDI